MRRHIHRLKRALGLDRLHRLFPPDDRGLITAAVRRAESKTSGEIVVRIINKCDKDLRKIGNPINRAYEQAVREFRRLGIGWTKGKTGVLILIIVGDRRFQIFADNGIYVKLPRRFWADKAATLSGHFRASTHTAGICRIVFEIGDELARHFPSIAGKGDELGDEPVIGDDEGRRS